jgi:hypothetical protein
MWKDVILEKDDILEGAILEKDDIFEGVIYKCSA